MKTDLKILALIACLSTMLFSCKTNNPVVWSPYKIKKRCSYKYKINGKVYCVLKNSIGYIETGIASWYGPGFHGQKTASGEVYNMYKLTAAHRTLPLGTYVVVTNLENGKKVIVKINDRGPFVHGRIIDLSYAAAKRIGMVKKGTARVRIVALGKISGSFIKFPPYRTGKFYVQIGAFKNKLNAYKKMHSFRRKTSAKCKVVKIRGLYRVVAGPVPSYDTAKKLQRRLNIENSFIIELE